MDSTQHALQDVRDLAMETQLAIERLEDELKAKPTEASVKAQQNEITFLREALEQKDEAVAKYDKQIRDLEGQVRRKNNNSKQKDASRELSNKKHLEHKAKMNAAFLAISKELAAKVKENDKLHKQIDSFKTEVDNLKGEIENLMARFNVGLSSLYATAPKDNGAGDIAVTIEGGQEKEKKRKAKGGNKEVEKEGGEGDETAGMGANKRVKFTIKEK